MSTPHSPPGPAAAFSAFRNVSACNRCRVRKNRCDQNMPACSACEKAKVPCVGYDPITKKEVPRSYVYYLENRTEYLESVLVANGIEFESAETFVPPRAATNDSHGNENNKGSSSAYHTIDTRVKVDGEPERVNKLVSSASNVAVHGISDSRFLGTASGISFARVVFAAIKSVANSSGMASERFGRAPSVKSEASTSMMRFTGTGPLPTSMRESFFGLDTKSTARTAPFPSRDLGMHLVNLYFQHANPQFPILHRLEFNDLVSRVYDNGEKSLTERERYLLNMVFAIGAAVIVGKPLDLAARGNGSESPDDGEPPVKRRKIAEEQRPPEEYHAAAVIHLEAALGSNVSEGITSDLEELQAVLLLATFALLRPVPPGLWYIVGVATRLAIDLGLHADDGVDIDRPEHPNMGYEEAWKQRLSSPGMGRKQYLADFRRRLWWCVYSFDRLVSSVVGRPFGISDQMVSTSFPSILDDIHISPAGITYPPDSIDLPVSYKRVSFHYFRLRLLHSEILQVLSHRQTQLLRAKGIRSENKYMNTDLSCPFLDPFGGSFKIWREDVDKRLYEWFLEAPRQDETGVQFSPLFLELNYWQTVLMLYRQSLSTPVALAEDASSATESVASPVLTNIEAKEDEEIIYMKVAQAGQKVLKLYRRLHRKYLVNYTYLATHHLFMAGISFLYAIWHSPLVRSGLTLDDVDFTVLAATSVLDDLVVFCPPAKSLRDAFSKMTKTTIKMCIATTGFGAQVQLDKVRRPQAPTVDVSNPASWNVITPASNIFDGGSSATTPSQQQPPQQQPHNPNFAFAPAEEASQRYRQRKMPQFEVEDWSALFSQEDIDSRTLRPFAGQSQQQYAPAASDASGASGGIPGTGNSLQLDPSLMNSIAAGGIQDPNNLVNIQALKSPWSDSLDFLDSISLPDQTTASMLPPSSSGSHSGVASAGQAPFVPSALDMGVGFGWDGSVPGGIWEDGDTAPVDLFDGFFFGGNIPSMGGAEQTQQ